MLLFYHDFHGNIALLYSQCITLASDAMILGWRDILVFYPLFLMLCMLYIWLDSKFKKSTFS